MYTPPVFEMKDRNAMLDAIEQWNFGQLITHSGNELRTSLIPFTVDRANNRLLAHVARANPHWRELESASHLLVSFQGPHCYVSPNWYQSRDLVPTWNYVMIQVTGHASLVTDSDQLLSLLNELVEVQESVHARPWTTDQVSASAMSAMTKAIVGFSIDIEEIVGKAKLSQNRPVIDQQSVIDTLDTAASDDERAIASLMRSTLQGLQAE